MKQPTMKKLPLKLFFSLIFSFIVGLANLANANADTPALSQLENFLANTKAGRANFSQFTDTQAQTSHGSFSFERPARFKFAYTAPFAQLILADGKTLWIYDEDLEQVTKRPLADALLGTPAALLTSASSLSALEQDFTLEALSQASELSSKVLKGEDLNQDWGWISARPRSENSQLQQLWIGFADGKLKALEMLDGFGQRSVLVFDDFEVLKRLSPSEFEFTPPAGVDVLE